MNAPVPTSLFDAIKRDLQPVRPLASPVRRALALVPLAVVLLVGLPWFWSWRYHSALAPWPATLLSLVESALSFIILAAAFREAVPGRALTRRALTGLVGAAVASFVFVNATARSPIGTAPSDWIRWLWECMNAAVSFSIPALIVPAWLVSRALPVRPSLTGALCGLGIGVMADAGMRLLCWDGDYLHVLVAHGGAIAVLCLLGALSATLVERLKSRRASKAG